MHVSKDVSYGDDNIILSFVYQVPDVNPRGMFWTITNGRYQIVDENVLNNFQDIVVTLGIITLVANITMGGVLMKEKPIVIFHNSNFFVLIAESPFINICDSSNEDGPSPLDVVVHVFTNLQVDKKMLFRWKCHS